MNFQDILQFLIKNLKKFDLKKKLNALNYLKFNKFYEFYNKLL